MKIRAIIIILLFIPAIVASAQTRKDPKHSDVIRIDTDLISIDVTAFDKNGNYVRDLKEGDIELYEDGQLKKLGFFAESLDAAQSRPLAVVFALDISGSMRSEEAETLRKATMNFAGLMKGESYFAALSFNHKINILQTFTSDGRKLESALKKMNDFGGSTRLYDAIDRSVTMLTRQAPRTVKNRPLRRVVVVITDGFDSSSTIDRKEMIRRATTAGITVYSITIPSYVLSPTTNNQRVITLLDATRIVKATGGRDFSADSRDFTPVLKSLAEEIKASYTLAYYPELRDGKYHELRVKINRPDIQIRVNRTGYQAPSQNEK